MLTVNVNGEERDAPRGDRNLLSFLRFDLGLTGAKYGCGEGLCGACTVLVDGQPPRGLLVGNVTVNGLVVPGPIFTDGASHLALQREHAQHVSSRGLLFPQFPGRGGCLHLYNSPCLSGRPRSRQRATGDFRSIRLSFPQRNNQPGTLPDGGPDWIR